ncbi:hypothetical protein PM082_009963 [Marasmius tenuissimus]|nr:hypothetical protein PM082_009963 [Marasmius tenuissimus]
MGLHTEATVALGTFLEDVALSRHVQTHPEPHNIDPSVEAALTRVDNGLGAVTEKGLKGGKTAKGEYASLERHSETKKLKKSTSLDPEVERVSKTAQKRKRHHQSKKVGRVASDFTTPPEVSWRQVGQRAREGTWRDFFSHLQGSSRGSVGREQLKKRNALRNAYKEEDKLGGEIATPATSFKDVSEDSRIASTAWQGMNASRDERQEIRAMIHEGQKLPGITAMPYHHKRLFIADDSCRVVIFRSKVTYRMLHHLLPRVNAAAQRFMDAVKWPSEEDMKNNLRGEHFCVGGHDRNNKEASFESLTAPLASDATP